MASVKGLIESKNSKEFPAKKIGWKPSVKVSLKINGDWYSAFSNKDTKAMLDAVNEGDVVELSYETAGDEGQFKNIIQVEKLPEDTLAKAAKEVASLAKDQGSLLGGNQVPTETQAIRKAAEDKDYRIGFNGNLKVAVEIVGIALSQEALTLPTKKADKLDAIVEATIKVAHTLTEASFIPPVKVDVKEVVAPATKDTGGLKE